MKPQDLVFFLVFVALFLKKDPRWFAVVGIFLLIAAIPLFAKWVFFSAERFVDYAFLLFCVAAVLYLFQTRKSRI